MRFSLCSFEGYFFVKDEWSFGRSVMKLSIQEALEEMEESPFILPTVLDFETICEFDSIEDIPEELLI